MDKRRECPLHGGDHIVLHHVSSQRIRMECPIVCATQASIFLRFCVYSPFFVSTQMCWRKQVIVRASGLVLFFGRPGALRISFGAQR